MIDPMTGSGEIFLIPEAKGRDGHPLVMHVAGPPQKRGPGHHHLADGLYVYPEEEPYIEGQGVCRAGDLWWTRVGHPYGLEITGPHGGDGWVITQGSPQPGNHDGDLATNAALTMPSTAETDGLPGFLAPGSHKWPHELSASVADLSHALMNRGDILRVRADLISGRGENAYGAVRRVISASCCAGWGRPVENSLLNIPTEVARTLSKPLQDLLGFAPRDATGRFGEMLGLYQNGDPQCALETE